MPYYPTACAAELPAGGPTLLVVATALIATMCKLREKARRRWCAAAAEKANRALATREHGLIA